MLEPKTAKMAAMTSSNLNFQDRRKMTLQISSDHLRKLSSELTHLYKKQNNVSPLFMTEPGKMGSNSPFTEIELAIVHESLRNAEKDATNRILIS